MKKILLIASSLTVFASQGVSQNFTPIQPETFKDNMALSNAWGDFDNDGDLDLVISFKTGDVRLYQNNKGEFSNIGVQMGLPTGGKETRSVAWGDYNADGYLDLYVGSNRNGNELYRNEKGKRFTEVGVKLGVDIPHVSTRQISWVDFDNNGTVDLFVADRMGTNYLLMIMGSLLMLVSKRGLMTLGPLSAHVGLIITKTACLICFLLIKVEPKTHFIKMKAVILSMLLLILVWEALSGPQIKEALIVR